MLVLSSAPEPPHRLGTHFKYARLPVAFGNTEITSPTRSINSVIFALVPRRIRGSSVLWDARRSEGVSAKPCVCVDEEYESN
jgi:hypothetical protein